MCNNFTESRRELTTSFGDVTPEWQNNWNVAKNYIEVVLQNKREDRWVSNWLGDNSLRCFLENS